ncbi:MAG: phosphoglycerate kinase [Candidatus Liptonbacteria bacterium]|nr:phosphoglycerate kinase [Candidatus Liptonbacteria bacterium]
MIKFLEKTPKKYLGGVALLRLDFNTEDDWRMKAAMPTIRFILKNARAVVVLSHRGKPKSEDKKFSLKKDAVSLGRFLNRKVKFLPGFDFRKIKNEIDLAPKGAIFVLENLRFLPGEEKNDNGLAKNLASLGSYYVNEAFSVSHRAHASVSAITKFLPGYAGMGFAREITVLGKVLNKPEKPLVVVLGGGKAYDKLRVLENLKNKTARFLIGGVAANTLSYLSEVEVGSSLIEKDPSRLRELKGLLKFKNIVLPVDFRKKGSKILDIGPVTAEIFGGFIAEAKTIIWNGPVGYFEDPGFAKGSIAVAKAIGKNKKAFSVVGGGETVAFLAKNKLLNVASFVSTGGGAMLDFLAGKKLPGITALESIQKNAD